MKYFIKNILLCITFVSLTISLGGCDFISSFTNGSDSSSDSSTYTILYSYDGGNGSIIVTYGEVYTIDYKPEKTGYEFSGWYDAESGGTKYVNSSGASLSTYNDKYNITLYAQFESIQYSLILDYQESSITGTREYTVSYGEQIPELPLGSDIDNKIFIGWFTMPNGEGTQVSDSDGLIPIKSIFTIDYFDINDESSSSTVYAYYEFEIVTVTFYYSSTEYVVKEVVYGTSLYDVAPTEYGKYLITSWSTKENDLYLEYVFDEEITSDTILYIATMTNTEPDDLTVAKGIIDLIDFSSLNLGEEYLIGENVDLIVTISNVGILEYDNGYLKVVGVSLGQIEITGNDGDETLYSGMFNVYNSPVVIAIKQQLIDDNIINAMSDSLTKTLISELKELNLDTILKDNTSYMESFNTMTGLEKLSVRDNDLSDIEFITKITNLKELDISGNKIVNIEIITALYSLEYLDISNNLISNINSITYLQKLKYLNINNNNISEIDSISSCYYLEKLDIGNNPIASTTITAIGTLSYLTELSVANLSIDATVIYSLGYLNNLTSLNMEGIKVELTKLSNCVNLTNLNISNTQITSDDLYNIGKFTKLECLTVSNNSIDDIGYNQLISGLSTNNVLSELVIGNNKITSLIPVNSIDGVDQLSKIKNLSVLDISESYYLSSFSELANFTNLSSLIVDNCSNLVLQDNEIMDTLTKLSNLNKLSIIGLFAYSTETVYDDLITKVKESSTYFKLRLTYVEWLDKDNISNYSQQIFFSYDEFLTVLDNKSGNNYTFKDTFLYDSVVLNFSNETINDMILYIPSYINEISIYSDDKYTHDIAFNIESRDDDSISIVLYNLNVYSDVTFITAATGSELYLTNKINSQVAVAQSNIAINVYDLFIKNDDINNTFNITGGQGYTGADGADADTSDMSTKAGKDGGNGCSGILCHDITFLSNKIIVKGGTGGSGGDGGDSTAGWAAMFNWAKGGDGGDGGNGGYGIAYSGTYTDTYINTVLAGDAGTGGSGGGVRYGSDVGSAGSKGGQLSAIQKI